MTAHRPRGEFRRIVRAAQAGAEPGLDLLNADAVSIHQVNHAPRRRLRQRVHDKRRHIVPMDAIAVAQRLAGAQAPGVERREQGAWPAPVQPPGAQHERIGQSVQKTPLRINDRAGQRIVLGQRAVLIDPAPLGFGVHAGAGHKIGVLGPVASQALDDGCDGAGKSRAIARWRALRGAQGDQQPLRRQRLQHV